MSPVSDEEAAIDKARRLTAKATELRDRMLERRAAGAEFVRDTEVSNALWDARAARREAMTVDVGEAWDSRVDIQDSVPHTFFGFENFDWLETDPEVACRIRDHRRVIPAVRQAIDQVCRGQGVHRIVLLGPSGVGKTSLAWAILGHLAEEGPIHSNPRDWGGFFCCTTDLTGAESALVAVVDDLGAEADVHGGGELARVRRQICRVLRARYDNAYTTIYTSAYTPDQLEQFYGVQNARRIFGACARIVEWQS